MAMAALSGLAVLSMIALTTADIVLRTFANGLKGSYDLVRIAGALSIALALPYTTAVKGHVAVEFFFQKMNRTGRIVVDSLCRVLVIGLLSTLSWQCVVYGNILRRTGQVSLTLQIPMYWLAYVIGIALAVTVLVKVHNLLHPGREMIKP
jgi:TRAP-type C4-dicarboxylate transport system permease small subunit